MRNYVFPSFVLALLLGLSACTLPPLHGTDRTQVEDLLAYYHRVGRAPLELQRKEFQEAQAANERAPDDETRIRLALMLMLPGAPWRDDVRLTQLLGAVQSSTGDHVSPMQDFVVLLERMVQLRREEQKRCEQKLEGLRDERRKLDQKLESARDECRRADVLQQKLDELRDIDRDLRSRRPTRRTKP